MEQVGPDELIHWMAYHKTSPISKDRDDLNAALIAQTVANCHSKRPIKIQDIVLHWGRKPLHRGANMMKELQRFLGSI